MTLGSRLIHTGSYDVEGWDFETRVGAARMMIVLLLCCVIIIVLTVLLVLSKKKGHTHSHGDGSSKIQPAQGKKAPEKVFVKQEEPAQE